MTTRIRYRSACNSCTTAHTKCDGKKPCGACRRKESVCEYEPMLPRGGNAEDRRRRREEMEELLAKMRREEEFFEEEPFEEDHSEPMVDEEVIETQREPIQQVSSQEGFPVIFVQQIPTLVPNSFFAHQSVIVETMPSPPMSFDQVLLPSPMAPTPFWPNTPRMDEYISSFSWVLSGNRQDDESFPFPQVLTPGLEQRILRRE